jgi:hypothetical protein
MSKALEIRSVFHRRLRSPYTGNDALRCAPATLERRRGMKLAAFFKALPYSARAMTGPFLARPSLTQPFRACLAPPCLAYPGRSRPGRTLPTHACRSTPRLVTTVEHRRASLARAQCSTTTILRSTCEGMPRGRVRTAQGRRCRHWPSQRAQVSKSTHMRNPLKVPTWSVASLGRSTFHVKQPR